MSRKGFTLVELLAVIIILGLISVIVFPQVNSIIKNQREKLYEKQVSSIEQSAESWATANTDKLPNASEFVYVKLDTLMKDGYLKNDDIKDPRTDEVMTGCVGIYYDVDYNQYSYTYINPTDESYVNECE